MFEVSFSSDEITAAVLLGIATALIPAFLGCCKQFTAGADSGIDRSTGAYEVTLALLSSLYHLV